MDLKTAEAASLISQALENVVANAATHRALAEAWTHIQSKLAPATTPPKSAKP